MEATQARAERFGGLLRLYRTRLALTQEGLAERAGVSTRSIRAAELGQTHPQRETAQRLADALQLEKTERDELLAAAAPAPRRTGTFPAFDAHLETQAAECLPPAPPTRFIGREVEMRHVLDLLRRPDVPLITLTGAGGVGKTRLAVEAAHAAQASFPGGVIFVGLAALDTPQLLLATVANACGLRELGAQPILTSLANYLHNKKVLLLLDNFEHLAEAAPDLAALLRMLPHAKFLTTSRMPLHLQGEHLLPLEPLALPAADRINPDAANESEAVRLFVQRAAMVKPGFTLDAANVAAVAAITHHLDGLPLAIELAAARSAVLPPQALLGRLSHPLEVLTGGPRDLPPRHQTLRNTIAWSYALLTPAEQALFRRLSVCAGGCLPAAAAVIASDGAQDTSGKTDEDSVIETLLSLAEKNMLQAEVQTAEPTAKPTAEQAGEQVWDGVRFSMLETIRQYGREQLAAAGETEQTQRRHAVYYLRFAEGAAEHLQGPDQLRRLQRLDSELPNLRGALAWQPSSGAEQGGANRLLEDKLRVAGKLFLYWHLRGRYTEAITWLNGLLALPGADAPTVGRAWALTAAAALKASTGDNTTVYAQGSEALDIARRLNDPQTLANALHVLGTLDVALSPPDALLREDSVRHLVEAVQLRRACNDLAGTALTVDYMGFRLLRNGDYAGALPHFQEGLALGQSLHDHWTTGMALLGMAEATYLLGDVPAAQALALRSLEHHQALDDQHGSGHILGLLGDLAQSAGDFAAAKEYYDESIRALQAMGEAPRNVRTLWALAPLTAAVGDLERSLTLAGAAVNLSQTALVSPYKVDDPRLAPLWALAGQTPAEAMQTAAWQAGAAMDLGQAVAYAARREQN